jgi:hypothetical protein
MKAPGLVRRHPTPSCSKARRIHTPRGAGRLDLPRTAYMKLNRDNSCRLVGRTCKPVYPYLGGRCMKAPGIVRRHPEPRCSKAQQHSYTESHWAVGRTCRPVYPSVGRRCMKAPGIVRRHPTPRCSKAQRIHTPRGTGQVDLLRTAYMNLKRDNSCRPVGPTCRPVYPYIGHPA